MKTVFRALAFWWALSLSGSPARLVAAPPSAGDSDVRGFYSGEGARRSLMPCGATEALAVLDRTGGVLDQVYRSLAKASGRPLFVELRGRRNTRADGAARGSFVATSVRRAKGEGGSCDEPLFPGEFRASGDEPAWGLEIARSGLRYLAPGQPDVVLPYAAARGVAGHLKYESTLAGPTPRTLDVDLAEKACVDPRSGERFAWTASVRLDGRLVRGCALEGGELPGVR